jgi:histidyl-tRNA synthetase
VPLAYVVHDGDAATRLAWRAGEMLRDAGHCVVVNGGGGSFKSQMKKADASGARYALLIGADEAAADAVSVKPLREPGEQRTVPLDELRGTLSAG